MMLEGSFENDDDPIVLSIPSILILNSFFPLEFVSTTDTWMLDSSSTAVL